MLCGGKLRFTIREHNCATFYDLHPTGMCNYLIPPGVML